MASARHFGDPSSSPSIWPAAPLGPKTPKEAQALPVTRPPESVSPEALSKLQASSLTIKNPLFIPRISSIL
jgi:hypothetical protein